jgi:hypothetical protein
VQEEAENQPVGRGRQEEEVQEEEAEVSRRQGRWAAGLVATAAALTAWAVLPAAASAAPHCDGDGTSGKRVQAVYAHVDGQASVGNADALISAWAEQVDRTFNVSAHKTAPAGFAFPRWAFTAGCGSLDIAHITIGDPGTSFQALRVALGAANNSGGIGATQGTLAANLNRKYMVFLDKPDCGGPTSDFLPDATADPDFNVSNQNPGTGFQRAMIARYCLGSWSQPPSPLVVNFGIPHELAHLLGAVSPNAPHALGGHTSQFFEVMSAGDVPPSPECTTPFEGLDAQLLLDCGNDDYFSMNPPIGSYLATNWNVARSCFLATSGVQNRPPDSVDCPTTKCKKAKKKKRQRSAEAAKKKQQKCKKKRKKRR